MISNSTAYDIIYNALQICGVISYGEAIEPAIAKTALQMLNAIRGEWSGKYINYRVYDQTYTPTSGTYSITMGTSVGLSGNILTRAAEINEVIVSIGTLNYQIPVKSYAEYRQRTFTQVLSLPGAAYLDTNYPIQTLYFYPGLAVGYSVRVLGLAYLAEYENVSDVYVDPPELFQCLIYALSLKLSPMFGTDPNTIGTVYPMLQSALKGIKAINFKTRMQRAKNDLGTSESYSFFTGGF